jgi:hypothetical protein
MDRTGNPGAAHRMGARTAVEAMSGFPALQQVAGVLMIEAHVTDEIAGLRDQVERLTRQEKQTQGLVEALAVQVERLAAATSRPAAACTHKRTPERPTPSRPTSR